MFWAIPDSLGESAESKIRMPNLPFEEPELKDRTGGWTWVLVAIGAAAFIGVFIFFGTRW